MSSSASVSIAETAALYQSVITNNSAGLAVITLLVYDLLLCIGKEVNYGWRTTQSSRRISRILYLYNRYMPLLFNLINAVALPPLSDTSCTGVAWGIQVFRILSFIGPAVFTTLRVYALSGRNKVISGITLVLSMGPFLVNASTLYQASSVNLPPPINCQALLVVTETLEIGLVIASRASVIIADTLAVAVTWRRTRTARRLSRDILRQSSLEHTFWENGNIYFGTVASLNVLDIILVVLSIAAQLGGGGSYITAFVDPLSQALTCRFLLALYETNAILERGESSVASLSAAFSGTGRAGSPELPKFLSPLAGPMHSFSDGDPELFEDERGEPDTEAETGSETAANAEAIETVTVVREMDGRMEVSSSGQVGEVEGQV